MREINKNAPYQDFRCDQMNGPYGLKMFYILRSQDEEARTAGVIRKCTSLFTQFILGLDNMTQSQRSSGFFKVVDLGEMIGVLEDLITYFAQPEDGLSHEDNQKFLKALKNRQDLFQEEGILNLVLDAIDKMNVITGQGILSALAGLATNSLYLVSFW